MVVGVVGLERMEVQGQGKSSCSDVGTLVVVVELVGMVIPVVLGVLEVLLDLGYRVLLVVLEVHLVLALLVLLVVPLVLDHLEVLGLVEVVVVEVEVVGEVGEVVGMVQQVLREGTLLLQAILGNCNHMGPAIAYGLRI